MCRGRESQWRPAHRAQEGDFMSPGDGESRVKREREKDAKNWKRGTIEVGKLSETTVQISRKPCHLCSPQRLTSIVNRIKNFFLFNLFTLKLLLCPCYHHMS